MTRADKLPFIKGAVGHGDFGRLAELGANAVRLSRVSRKGLDAAAAAGLGVLAGLPVKPERNGMDYDDTRAIADQHEEVMALVQEFKDHPALMIWCVGNELDHIPDETPYNRNVWNAVNDLVRDIHKIDSDHPALTAVGMGRFGKIEECAARCPDLDLMGVNAYGKINQAHGLLQKHGWTKPYVFTEWGMTGAWERPRTEWAAPFEECSATKADCYLRRYRDAILAYPEQCIGGFAFYWGWRHETTLSWYNMHGPKGHEMESVAAMESLWKEKPLDTSAPHLFGLRVNGIAAPDNVFLKPGQKYPLEALTAPEGIGPNQRFGWELRPEVKYGAYAGSGETLPPEAPEAIAEDRGEQAVLHAPQKPGKYRVFVYLYDGQNRFATANLPVHVGGMTAE
ncbi:MAG: glycoside hydrolase family 2 TIM barrel-domain containing protein [Candidatus Sumerlaeia bacterium]